jgi:hypothetical protein
MERVALFISPNGHFESNILTKLFEFIRLEIYLS